MDVPGGNHRAITKSPGVRAATTATMDAEFVLKLPKNVMVLNVKEAGADKLMPELEVWEGSRNAV